ncbi:MAG: alpha-L-fucosidase, partial [Gemmatimonadota bacterium]
MRLVRAATILAWAVLAAPTTTRASAQETERVYVEETDPLVRQKLERWQDLKLGLLMHWGPYSQWGIVESWSLCSEDEEWCRRSMDDYDEWKDAY